MWKLVWELEMVSLVSGNLEIQKTVFLGGSLGLLKHEFGGFLSDFADSYLSFLGIADFLGFIISFFIFQCLFYGNKDLSSFHPSNAWDFEDQKHLLTFLSPFLGNLFFELPNVDFDGSSGLSGCGILTVLQLFGRGTLTHEIEKLVPAWKPKSQASNASLDGFIQDVNFLFLYICSWCNDNAGCEGCDDDDDASGGGCAVAASGGSSGGSGGTACTVAASGGGGGGSGGTACAVAACGDVIF
ncbi:hypothetical protein RIR_jg2414.t2 [Rhizophagus irregularis DAOM 181602=DAOM 197198]|nr:hypothetical protein RIR_jg2414.t2 [Rhizophagus irregularis DAOM 181602=DAOM 197198]